MPFTNKDVFISSFPICMLLISCFLFLFLAFLHWQGFSQGGHPFPVLGDDVSCRLFTYSSSG